MMNSPTGSNLAPFLARFETDIIDNVGSNMSLTERSEDSPTMLPALERATKITRVKDETTDDD
jgi:hypothetical protein